jgi:hypothetical protein
MKKIATGVMLIGICWVILPGAAGAEEIEIEPVEVKYTIGFVQGYQLGEYWPSLNGFNKQKLRSRGLEPINSLFYDGFMIGYLVNPHLRIDYFTGSGNRRVSRKFGTGDVKSGKVEILSHQFTLLYKLKLETKWCLSFGAGLDYHKVIYEEEETPLGKATTLHRWQGDTWGGDIMFDIYYRFTPIVALGGSLTYNIAKISNMSEGGVTDDSFPSVDLNGPFIKLGFQISF